MAASDRAGAGMRRRCAVRLFAWVGLAVLSAPALPSAPVGAAPATRCTSPSQQLLPEVPWTHRRLDPPRVWPLTRGEGVLVAVVDTGGGRGRAGRPAAGAGPAPTR